MLDPGVAPVDLPKAVVAIGALGTAAYGLVDASKGFWGGISNRGFGDIRKVISRVIPRNEDGSAAGLSSALETLRANWMNGMAMADQKAIAKALIKLNLKPGNAGRMAEVTGVDGHVLETVARKLGTGESLTQGETDVFGRFDLLLSALLDQAYQRGDQRYRNSAKVAAVVASLSLAWLGVWAGQLEPKLAIIAGLLATPLAPVAKDLASAIQAAAKLAQFRKR